MHDLRKYVIDLKTLHDKAILECQKETYEWEI